MSDPSLEAAAAENPQLKEVLDKVKEGEEKERQDLVKTLSVRERFTRRYKYQYIEIPFCDDLGEFTIKCRLVSEREGQAFARMRDDLAGITDTASYQKVMDKLIALVAYPDGIVQEKEMDKAFFESGEYTSNDLFRIIGDAIRATAARVEDSRLFRKDQPRTIST
jgi:hypothetical protein